MEVVVSCLSLFAGEQIELLRPFIAALLGVGLKQIFLFQMSPRATFCSRAIAWAVENYNNVSGEVEIVSHNSYCIACYMFRLLLKAIIWQCKKIRKEDLCKYDTLE